MIIQEKIIYKFHFEKMKKNMPEPLEYISKNILSQETVKLCF